MKKLYLSALALLAGTIVVQAQPWMEGNLDKRVKLKDVVDAYEMHHDLSAYEEEEEGEDEKEEGNYQFSRWLWYWEGHTDANGYIVSPVEKLIEWQKLEAKKANRRAAGKSTAPDANWTFEGPTNPLGGNKGVGRINVISFHPTDTNTYMIGSPGGGLWKTTDDGGTWQVMNDFFPVLGIADIDYNPLNPKTIYVCTGDRDAGDTYSVGVLKSTDGGQTWNQTGFTMPISSLGKTYWLLINPLDTNSLTLAASTGIFKSFDGGQNWTNYQGGNFKEVHYHPTDTSILYATGRIGSGTYQVYRSSNGGQNWQQVTSFPGNSRTALATTPANPAIVKAIVANPDYGLHAVYNSTDTGKTFTSIYEDDTSCKKNILASTSKGNKCGGQGWYDLTIEINPADENIVMVGGVNTWYSKDGGQSWTIANQWTTTLSGVTIVHADKHYHKFHPLRPNILYECNDGGIYKTADPTSSNGIWNNLSDGLGITQFYRNAVSDIATYVLGGAQDNGTKRLIGGTSDQMTGADGMDCHTDPVDSNTIYTSQQYGELRRSLNGGKNFKDIQNTIPGKPKGDWITPFALHPNNRKVLVAAYKEVYYTSDQGNSWVSISPDFGDEAKRVALTPLDDDYIYIIVNNGIRMTKDFGDNWSNIFSTVSGTLSDIIVDPYNKDKIWTTFRSYTGNKVASYENGKGWTTYNDSLPNMPVNCIIMDTTNQTMYVGTDLGVFYREFPSNEWHEFNNGTLPNVEVIDLDINHTTGEIVAATYGRGMWRSPVHKTNLGINNTVPFAEGVVTISPNPNYGSFEIQTDNNYLNGKTATVRLFNVTGSKVWENNVTFSNGRTSIKAQLPRGTYIVEVNKDNTIFTKTKMVVY